MRWQYTGPGGGSLDSKPPATEVDREYILFALRMFRENSELMYTVTPGLDTGLDQRKKRRMSYYMIKINV